MPVFKREMPVFKRGDSDSSSDDVFPSDQETMTSRPDSLTSLVSEDGGGGGGVWKVRVEEVKKDLKNKLDILKSRMEDRVGSVRGLFPNKRRSIPSQTEGDRTLHLDFQKSVRQSERRLKRRGSSMDKFEWEDDEQLKNVTSSMIVHSLRDGMLCAEVPLGQVPTGELILRERSNNLILITKPSATKNAVPKAFGYIELPIFLDSRTLEFELSRDTSDVLYVQGMLKGARRDIIARAFTDSPQLELRRSSSQSLVMGKQKKAERANSY